MFGAGSFFVVGFGMRDSSAHGLFSMVVPLCSRVLRI